MLQYRRILPVVSSFLFAAATSQEQQKVTSDRPKSTMAQNSEANQGLSLYYDPFSFYSQKVVMTLHEKKLSFEKKIINLVKSEQYESWFLEINPRGEVPVLQDTGKIIPDSARIIDYLEDNFSNGNSPRLIPTDSNIRKKITHFRNLINQAPQAALTTAACMHSNLIKNPKTPFFGPVRSAIANAEKNAGANLRKYAEQNPAAKELLLKKAATREETYNKLLSEEYVMQLIDQTDKILAECESELAAHTNEKENWWLCSEEFTIADVELAMIMIRMYQLGFEEKLWVGKYPNLEKYFAKVQQRDAYNKTIPGTIDLIKSIILSEPKILIGLASTVAIIIGGTWLAKRLL